MWIWTSPLMDSRRCMDENTDLVRIQKSKWVVFSTVVQAQVIAIGAAFVAAAEGGTTAGWINAAVVVVTATMTVIGRFAAEGPVSWSKPAPEAPTEVKIVSAGTPPPSTPPAPPGGSS